MAKYERLLKAYSSLSYEIEIVPRNDVESRADFVLTRLAD